MHPDDWLEILIRMGAAIACGAVVGFEREFQAKPAGLRTHMMVALGSASFTLVTMHIFQATLESTDATRLGIDPIRVVSGVIGGIGFLGAGTIIQSRAAVHGITTAATIWVVGSVGIACGTGYYIVALFTVAFSLLILLGVGGLGFMLERRNGNSPRHGGTIGADESDETDDEQSPPSSDDLKSHRGRTYTSRET